MSSPIALFSRRRLPLLAALLSLLVGGIFTLSALRAQSNLLSFGYDRGVQFVDPAGLGQLPFWLNVPSATVDFTLYGLTPEDFVKRQPAAQGWWQAPPLQDVSGLPVAATWQQSFSNATPAQIQAVRWPTGTVSAGLYVIEAKQSGSSARANMLLIVGRTALVMKLGAGGQVVGWATRLQTGAAVANLTVTIYDAQAQVLGQGITDASGVVKLTISSGKPYLAIGQADGESTAAGLNEQWASSDCIWCWLVDAPPKPYTIFLHSERPIYRPGDTISYNAVVRNNLINGYTPLAASNVVSVTLRDSRNNLVATQTKSADEFGALAGTFTLDTEPPLGDYRLELLVDGQTQSAQLRVEAYRKPEYEVQVSTPADFAISGDSIPVTVSADYYFGQPVANAQVKLQIARQPIYSYNYWWWYGHTAPNYGGGVIQELTGVTDSNGRWTTTFTPEALTEYSANYTFKATVTDSANQPVQGEQTVAVHWNGFTLAVQTDRYGYQTGEPVTVNLTARGHDQTPVANQQITVRLVRDEWDWQQQQARTNDVVPAQQVTTDAAGKAQVTFANVPQGWLRLIASSGDSRNRTVNAYNYLWVYNPSGADWWYWNNAEITVTADKDQYNPGDTANLLIQSRVRGVALLTLERSGVHRELVVPINGPVTAVPVPITADLAPNVFAKVQLFALSERTSQANAEGRLVSGQTELIVTALDKQLTVAITPDQTTYQPGAPASITVRTTNSSGQPVRARVSLAVVDEAIFALAADQTPTLFNTFYGRQSYNGVATFDSLVRHPYNYFGLPTTEVGLGTPVPTPSPPTDSVVKSPTATGAVRRVFLDTAYWNPSVVTNAQGEATVTFTLPDNLTTWRISARAVTVATEVGETTAKILVTQAIIARPTLPRFAVLGDRLRVGTVAQNFSGSDTSGSAELRSDPLLILNPAAQALTLPNRGSATAFWTAVAAHVGTGPVTTTVNTGNGQDMVELPLPVKPFAAPERWSSAGQVNPEVLLNFTVANNAINASTKFTLRLAPSVALGLLDGLDALIDYPYGCIEQTMSRVLPSAVAAKTYADLGIPNPKAGELPTIINQGLQKIYGFQHDNGSWGWFYDDDSGAYLTAYVLLGLHSIQQAGFAVEAKVLERGLAYLEQQQPSEPNTQAFALYVQILAGRDKLAPAQALIGQLGQLDAAGLASLALALQRAGDSSGAQQVADHLISRVNETGNYASWPHAQSQWDWHQWQSMSSTEKNTAFALRALLAIRPAHPLLPKVVRWLMDHRNGAGWGGYGSANTQATALAVLGLSDYIKLNNELQPNYSYRVLLNDQEIASGQLTPDQARQPLAPLVLTGDKLRQGANELRLVRDNAGQGQLYFTTLLEQQLFSDSFAAVSSLDRGLALSRSYKLVEGQARSDGAYNVGDVVEVTLLLTAKDRLAYVHVRDPIPAGFEALAEQINPSSWGDCFDCMGPVFHWREWGYNRKDLRDDRVDFFITDLYAGQQTLTYRMRATTPGEFSVLPGEAYPMYNEAIWGRSASQQVLVAPETLVNRPALTGDFDRNCLVDEFDTQLLAAVYGVQNERYNLSGAPLIDLRDLVNSRAWRGSSCLAQQAATLPPASGQAHFTLHSSTQQVGVGEEFTVDLTLAAGLAAASAASQIRGVGLDLRFNPNRAGLVRIQWHPALGNVLPLGPTVDEMQGLLSFGAIELPADFNRNEPLATLTLVGRGVGNTQFTVSRAEALDSEGRVIAAAVQGQNGVTVDGQVVYLTNIRR